MNNFKKAVGILFAFVISFAVALGLHKGLLYVFGSQKIVYNSSTGDADVGFGYPGDNIIPFLIFFGCLVLISAIIEKKIK